MTVEDKNRITEMRKSGLGYKKIAHALGVSESTVKTFCHRNDMASTLAEPVKTVCQDMPLKPCRFCGVMVLQYPGRKEKKYCSDSCRNKWWNVHLSETKRQSMSEYICPSCGKPFSAYDKRNRKYCSHECYIADRFGGVLCE